VSRRKHADHEEHENHERWLITYADMITLLMAFFVMMYGLSILDLKKFDQFKAGVAKQLGKSPIMDGGQGILISGTGVADSSAPAIGSGNRNGADDAAQTQGDVPKQDLPTLANNLQQSLAAAGLASTAEVTTDPRGLVIYVANRTLFKSGSAYLEWDGRKVLDQLAIALSKIDNQVIIEGHTDNVPIRPGGEYPSNWELSTARATQVLRWMVEARGLPSVRFSAAGYADTRPRVPNDTPDHRATNRRVEIVVVASDSPGGT
ncbi:MAG TPA: flagellar motor protein MotB, partial [Acidimicrobiales bacterium]|nr:flagellar motor protein MotB [Acidimicrobiales bacterium]